MAKPRRDKALDVLRRVHPDERSARIALGDWRLFLLSCTEIWGYRRGSEWLVSHYVFEPRG